MPHKPVVVGTGLVALDVVLDERHGRHELRAGGTCGNVLAILAYLGWEAFPVSRLGADVASRCIERDLARWNVRLDFARCSPACAPPVIVQRNFVGKTGTPVHRFSKKCPRCDAPFPWYKPVPASWAPQVASRIESPRVFLMDQVSRGALLLAHACRDRGALVVFEPSESANPRLFRQAVETADVLKYSQERMHRLSTSAFDARPLLEIETLGAHGLRYRRRGAPWVRLDAVKAPLLRDAAGAGDWCTSGLLHLLGRGGRATFERASRRTLRQALRFGQALSALNCAFLGARGAMIHVAPSDLEIHVARIMSGRAWQVPPRRFVPSSPRNPFDALCPACAPHRTATPLRRSSSLTARGVVVP